MDDHWLEKLAIHELCARFCRTIDAQDPDGWATCFTDTGAFEFDGWAISGRTALREYAEVQARQFRCRHLTLNMLYEVDGDRARGRAAAVVMLATPSGYKILSAGEYEDWLAKRDGAWLIEVRRLKTDRMVGALEPTVNLADPEVAPLAATLLEAARRLGRRVA